MNSALGQSAQIDAFSSDLFQHHGVVRSDGIGLGLALVKKVVESYQGTIWVESGGPGQGSCFRFTLPGAARPDGSVTVREQSLFAA